MSELCKETRRKKYNTIISKCRTQLRRAKVDLSKKRIWMWNRGSKIPKFQGKLQVQTEDMHPLQNIECF